MSFTLQTMLSIFDWKNISITNRVIEAAHSHYFQLVEKEIIRYFLDCESPVLGKMYQKLVYLDRKRAAKLLGAPETFNHLVNHLRKSSDLPARQAKKALNDYLTASLKVELNLASGKQLFKDFQNSWDCLGSLYYSRNGSKHTSQYLDQTIPIDFDSPFSKRAVHLAEYRKDKVGEWNNYSFEQRAIIKEKLERALLIIKNVNPVTYIFIKQNCSVVIPRHCLARKNSFSSGSCRNYPGRLMLTNAHLDFGDEKIINALIHESIHSYLYRLERKFQLIDDEKCGVDTLLNSPWSGNTLNINTFVHAIFVYYGISNFWKNRNLLQVFKSSTIVENIGFHQSGFESGDIARQLKPVFQKLHKECYKAILKIGMEI